jgi:hypothetical protein
MAEKCNSSPLRVQGRGLIEAGLMTARFLHLADICVRHKLSLINRGRLTMNLLAIGAEYAS